MKQSTDLNEAVVSFQREHEEKINALPSLPLESPEQKAYRETKEKRAEEERLIAEEARKKSEAILKTIETRKREIHLEIGKLKYPASSSEDAALRTIGETQIQSALVLMSSNLKRDALVKAIADSIAINRIDYASSVLDRVTSTMSKNAFETDYTLNDYLRLSDPGKQKLLILDCIETYHLYSKSGEIDKLQKEIVELDALKAKVNKIAETKEKVSKPAPVKALTEAERKAKEAYDEAMQEQARKDHLKKLVVPEKQKPMEMKDFGVIGTTGY